MLGHSRINSICKKNLESATVKNRNVIMIMYILGKIVNFTTREKNATPLAIFVIESAF